MCVPTYASAEAFYWTMQNLRKMFEYPYIYGGVGVDSCLPDPLPGLNEGDCISSASTMRVIYTR